MKKSARLLVCMRSKPCGAIHPGESTWLIHHGSFDPGFAGSVGIPYPCQHTPHIPMEPTTNSTIGRPKNWLVESILVTLLCCLPFGIVGIVNAANVNSRFDAGDFAGADKASKEAGKWTKIGFFVGLAGIVLYLVFVFVFGMTMIGAAAAGAAAADQY